MTRHEYGTIANIIKQSWSGDTSTEFELPTLIDRIACFIKANTPNFDKAEFVEACGI